MKKRTGFAALALFGSILLASLSAHAEASEAEDFRVTLLGTGSPVPSVKHFGPAVLVRAGAKTLLFDCGRGATQRLVQAGVRLGAVDAVFLTHLHSDHTVGIPDLWLTGWLPLPVASRKGPFVIYGPAGTRAMMESLEKAYEWDIRTRIADQNLAREDVAVQAHDFTGGVVYEADEVKVTAFEVDHGDRVKPAFGFRIDYRGHSAVLSGDTRFNENLIGQAAGTDLLVHQVAAAQPGLIEKSAAVRAILAHHTKPEEAGTVFARVKPRLAVYYHWSLQGGPGFAPPTEDDVIAQTRKTYAGPLVAGEDLMTFVIDERGVTMRREAAPVTSPAARS